jgi:hypothetical protein
MRIAMYDLQGYLLEVFEVKTYKQLEDDLKIPQGSLSSCISGRQLATINRQFREYKDKCRPINRIGDISNLSKHWNKPVHKFYKGKYICSYDCANEAAEINNIDIASINRCINNKMKTAGGFEWKYAN